VHGYLNYVAANNLSVSVGFNFSGRAYPDVSSMAHNVILALDGQILPFDSTAASVPTFAAFVSLVNAHRRKSGLSTLGYLNPLLYANFASIVKNDITVGSNRCTAYNGNSPVCCSEGFLAAPGWDPVTGLGSVDFHKFAKTCDHTYNDDTCPENPSVSAAFSWKSNISVLTGLIALVISIVTVYI